MRNIFSFFKKEQNPTVKLIRGRFDAASSSADNAKHWAAADALSADAEASPLVRATLRQRARYEIANNSYAKGIVLTLAYDVIGTGPRVQFLSLDEHANREAEKAFSLWAKEICLAEKLRTMRMARCQDGEAFIQLISNTKLNSQVKLDLVLVEADRVTGGFSPSSDKECDGITYDEFGNPLKYRVLDCHPGAETIDDGKAKDIEASHMIHLFRADRPGLHRGIPEVTPALPLFALLRRFTLAVITAAESAANFAGIMYTDAPAGGEADSVEAMDQVELERNMLLTLPAGWKVGQIDAKQPTSTYADFKHEILNEIARCLCMPYNIASGNSSGYNYASGRLDHQTYYKAIKVEREHIENVVLNRIFNAWMREYSLAIGYPLDKFPFIWIWDGQEHIDPAKEATAQSIRLTSLTTTLAAEYAKQGKDWEQEVRQIARERELLKNLGLTVEESTQTTKKEEDDE